MFNINIKVCRSDIVRNNIQKQYHRHANMLYRLLHFKISTRSILILSKYANFSNDSRNSFKFFRKLTINRQERKESGDDRLKKLEETSWTKKKESALIKSVRKLSTLTAIAPLNVNS